MVIDFCQLYDSNNEEYLEHLALAEIKLIRSTLIKECPYNIRAFLEKYLYHFFEKNGISKSDEDGKELALVEKIGVLGKEKRVSYEIVDIMHKIRIFGNQGIHQNFEVVEERDVKDYLSMAFKMLIEIEESYKNLGRTHIYSIQKNSIINSKIFLNNWEIELEEEDKPIYKKETTTWKEIEKELGVSERYIPDPDLEFLQYCRNEELENLYNILVFDPKDGAKRISQSLLENIKVKFLKDRYSLYWKEIAGEFQLYGGNSVVNLFRKKGIKYREILCDTCEWLRIDYDKKDSIENIEELFVNKVFRDAYEELNTSEKDEFLKNLKLSDLVKNDMSALDIIKGLSDMSALFKNHMENLMIKTIKDQISVISSLKELKFDFDPKNIALSLIPKNLKLDIVPRNINLNLNITEQKHHVKEVMVDTTSSALELFDIAGPAYRITTSSVLEIIFLRRKLNIRNNRGTTLNLKK